MDTFNVEDAETHLSKLLDRVEKGEEILLARKGKPVAKLTPVGAPRRKPGAWKGMIKIGDDFDDPLPPEMLKALVSSDRALEPYGVPNLPAGG